MRGLVIIQFNGKECHELVHWIEVLLYLHHRYLSWWVMSHFHFFELRFVRAFHGHVSVGSTGWASCIQRSGIQEDLKFKSFDGCWHNTTKGKFHYLYWLHLPWVTWASDTIGTHLLPTIITTRLVCTFPSFLLILS